MSFENIVSPEIIREKITTLVNDINECSEFQLPKDMEHIFISILTKIYMIGMSDCILIQNTMNKKLLENLK